MAYGTLSGDVTYDALDDKRKKSNPQNGRTSQTSTNNTYGGDNNNTRASIKNDPNLDNRLRQIQDREQKAIDLQKALEEKEKKLYGPQTKPKNLPKNWPTKSLAWARNDIMVDIAPPYRNQVRQFYLLWCITFLSVLCNWVVILWYEFGYEGSVNFGVLLLASIYVCVFLPCTWLFLYKKFYYAMQHNAQISYFFFAILILHILWTGLMASGLDLDLGTAGYLIMAREFVNKHHAMGLGLAISGSLWAINCIYTIYLLKVANKALIRYFATKYPQDDRL